MATNTRTETPAASAHRVPDAHAVESAGVRTPVGHAPSPADDRLLHPVRPIAPRPVRRPHTGTTAVGGRTTAAGNPPSSALLPFGAAPEAGARPLVPPTAVPELAGDLLGLPDFSALRRGLRRGWAWLADQLRASAEMDARLRARRDEDSAAMARAGVNPSRFG
ncbi:hypothetical protein RBS60_07455 [Sinomonas sp. ASV486]|uniref:hypothetical protein n=1 Tax=Sinomonas sp. ASV486 TaxID=3051170 RepID=UPI0027DCE43E|nr:hypothetical protein [Sinomonas sp. ASV486]MDQ4490033.1 hypothetical protein [Sinomonas sp. ASV486]